MFVLICGLVNYLFLYFVIDGFENKSKDVAQATDSSPGTKPLESLDLATGENRQQKTARYYSEE